MLVSIKHKQETFNDMLSVEKALEMIRDEITHKIEIHKQKEKAGTVILNQCQSNNNNNNITYIELTIVFARKKPNMLKVIVVQRAEIAKINGKYSVSGNVNGAVRFVNNENPKIYIQREYIKNDNNDNNTDKTTNDTHKNQNEKVRWVIG